MSNLATSCFGLVLLGASVLVITADQRGRPAWIAKGVIATATWFFPAGSWWVQ
jgi:hypothetical protein